MSWALIQSGKSAEAQSATTASITTPANVTAGNRLFVVCVSSTGTFVAPTDTRSTTYTQILSATNASGGKFAVYTGVVATTGTCTITATLSAAQQFGIGFLEFSGLDSSAGTGCLDVSATGAASTVASTPTGTTVATHASNQLALAFYADWGDNSTIAAPAGFTIDPNSTRNAALYAGQGVAYKNSLTAATEGGSFTGGAGQNIAGIAVIKIVQPTLNYQTNAGGVQGATVTAGGPPPVDGSTPYDTVSIGATGTLTYDNTHVLFPGGMSFYPTSGATSASQYVQWTGIPFAVPFYVSMCVYATANPGTNFRIFNLLNTASAVMAWLQFNTTGGMQAFDNPGTGTGQMNTTMPLNAWFRIEMALLVNSTTAGQIESRVFLDPFSAVPTETHTPASAIYNTAGGTPGIMRYGRPANTANGSGIWFTECRASTTGYPPPPRYIRQASGLLTSRRNHHQTALVRASSF